MEGSAITDDDVCNFFPSSRGVARGEAPGSDGKEAPDEFDRTAEACGASFTTAGSAGSVDRFRDNGAFIRGDAEVLQGSVGDACRSPEVVEKTDTSVRTSDGLSAFALTFFPTI